MVYQVYGFKFIKNNVYKVFMYNIIHYNLIILNECKPIELIVSNLLFIGIYIYETFF